MNLFAFIPNTRLLIITDTFHEIAITIIIIISYILWFYLPCFFIRYLNAKLYDYEEEMIRVYLDNEAAWGHRQTDFDDVMTVAKLLAKDGKDLLAWEVVSKKLHIWQPHEYHEVAPIDLLNDDVLFDLMSPQRCEAVLCTKYENKLNELEKLGL